MPNFSTHYNFDIIDLIFSSVSRVTLWEPFLTFYSWLQTASLFISLVLFLAMLYVSHRLSQIRKVERLALEKGTEKTEQSPSTRPEVKNPRWEHVKTLIQTEDEGNWRLAIIEADVMLEEMVARMQYPGETLGEQMKAIEKSDFNTIDNAWEAHKIRNNIAHQGSSYKLTRREARRAISLFESVFREFHLI